VCKILKYGDIVSDSRGICHLKLGLGFVSVFTRCHFPTLMEEKEREGEGVEWRDMEIEQLVYVENDRLVEG